MLLLPIFDDVTLKEGHERVNEGESGKEEIWKSDQPYEGKKK